MQRGRNLKNRVGRLLLLLMGGWTIQGVPPKLDKYVMIVAHHTSNWDFLLGIATKFIFDLKLRFFAKHSLFFPPLGWWMKALGGIPIERHKSLNRVEQSARVINELDRCILAIAPEGTRSKVKRWKSGFYHIAKKAKVPIVPVALDYKNRTVVFGEPVNPTDDQSGDFENLHRFFLPHQPKHPGMGCNGPFEEEQP